MTAPTAPQSDWLDKVIEQYGRYKWEAGAKVDGGFEKMTAEEAKAEILSRISEAEAAAELKGRRSEAVWWARNCNNPAYAELLAKRLERVQARQANTSGRE